jgi:putative ABC transport system ATP-binding protein
MESFCRQVNDAIDKILRSRHTTCLFVAHRLSTIARAERIVVLEGAHIKVYFLVAAEPPPLFPDGHISETGTYRELVCRLLIILNSAVDLGPTPAQVQRENSRFRALMAAQLNTAGEYHIPTIVARDTGTHREADVHH